MGEVSKPLSLPNRLFLNDEGIAAYGRYPNGLGIHAGRRRQYQSHSMVARRKRLLLRSRLEAKTTRTEQPIVQHGSQYPEERARERKVDLS